MKFKHGDEIVEVTVRRYHVDQPKIQEDVEQYLNKQALYEALDMLLNQGTPHEPSKEGARRSSAIDIK